MRTLIAHDLLARLGLDFETCRFTLNVKRTGGTVEATTVPAIEPTYVDGIAGNLGDFAELMRDGVAYQVVVDNGGAPGAITADGQPFAEDVDRPELAALLPEAAAPGVEIVTGLKEILDGIQVDAFEAIVERSSAMTLSYTAQRGDQDMLAPGKRRVTLACSGCGTDRNKKPIDHGSVSFRMPDMTCGYYLFAVLAEMLEAAGAPILARVELPQLRRLRIELAASGSGLVVTLPEGDDGAPCDGGVLSAFVPPPRRSGGIRVIALGGGDGADIERQLAEILGN